MNTMPEHSYSLAILFKMAMVALSVYKVASIIETHVHDQQAVLLMQLLKDPDSLLSHTPPALREWSSCQQLHRHLETYRDAHYNAAS